MAARSKHNFDPPPRGTVGRIACDARFSVVKFRADASLAATSPSK
jgi:hypothetical protein